MLIKNVFVIQDKWGFPRPVCFLKNVGLKLYYQVDNQKNISALILVIHSLISNTANITQVCT